MSFGSRLRTLALIACLHFVHSSVARAQENNADRAEELNNEGKKRIKQLDLEGAAELFRQAIDLSDDPRYSYNLCYTLEKSGKLEEARRACDSVIDAGDARLAKKAELISGKIDEKLGPRPTEAAPPPTDPQPGPDNRNQEGSSGPPPPPPPAEPTEEVRKVTYGGVVGVASGQLSGSSQGSVLGPALGPWLLLPIAGAYELVVDAQYVQRGGMLSEAMAGRFTLKNTYIDLGAAFRYRIGVGTMSYYVEGGLALSVLLNSESKFDLADSAVNSKDFSSLLGFGYVIKTVAGALDLRVRYIIGTLPVNSGDLLAGATQLHNRTFLVQGGYWF